MSTLTTEEIAETMGKLPFMKEAAWDGYKFSCNGKTLITFAHNIEQLVLAKAEQANQARIDKLLMTIASLESAELNMRKALTSEALQSPAPVSEAPSQPVGHEALCAIAEGECIAATEEFFKARPQLDTLHNRGIYEAGFQCGYEGKPTLAAPQVTHSEQQEPMIGNDGKPWPQTFDAMAWAKEFAKKYKVWSDDGVESDTVSFMLGWFANAIMIGHDTHAWRNPPAPHKPSQEQVLDIPWQTMASAWLKGKAAEQAQANEKYPRHAECYPTWVARVGILQKLAADIEHDLQSQPKQSTGSEG